MAGTGNQELDRVVERQQREFDKTVAEIKRINGWVAAERLRMQHHMDVAVQNFRNMDRSRFYRDEQQRNYEWSLVFAREGMYARAVVAREQAARVRVEVLRNLAKAQALVISQCTGCSPDSLQYSI